MGFLFSGLLIRGSCSFLFVTGSSCGFRWDVGRRLFGRNAIKLFSIVSAFEYLLSTSIVCQRAEGQTFPLKPPATSGLPPIRRTKANEWRTVENIESAVMKIYTNSGIINIAFTIEKILLINMLLLYPFEG